MHVDTVQLLAELVATCYMYMYGCLYMYGGMYYVYIVHAASQLASS